MSTSGTFNFISGFRLLSSYHTSQQSQRHDAGRFEREARPCDTESAMWRARPLYARCQSSRTTHLFPAPLRSPPVLSPTPSCPCPSSTTRATGSAPPCTFFAPRRRRRRCLRCLARERFLKRNVGFVKLEQTRNRDPFVPSTKKTRESA